MKKFKQFKNIGLFVKNITNNLDKYQNLKELKKIQKASQKVIQILKQQNCNVYLEPKCLKKPCDLIIVIGGDGSFLSTARVMVDHHVPILGIHKGNLGFLADLNFNKIKANLIAILNGKYIEERRILLNATINNTKSNYIALNDVILYNSKIPKLMEFEIYIDQQFVLKLRADGLIIATPTGSTAYALSAGGPILSPTLKVFNLVPMSAHTLSSRPLIIDENSSMQLKILNNRNNIDCGLCFDGQNNVPLSPGDHINITKHQNELKLIHPINYNYFATLREKLGWN